MTLVLALLGPITGLVGLILGGWITRNRESEKARKDRITAAYAKLLDASALATAPRAARLTAQRNNGETLGAEDEKYLDEIQAKFASAHSNIAIYGSKEVIEALSRFYDTVPGGFTTEMQTAYVALIKAMRRDSEAEDYAAYDEHVDNILVTGPARRAAAGAPKPRPITLGVTFSLPGDDEHEG